MSTRRCQGRWWQGVLGGFEAQLEGGGSAGEGTDPTLKGDDGLLGGEGQGVDSGVQLHGGLLVVGDEADDFEVEDVEE